MSVAKMRMVPASGVALGLTLGLALGLGLGLASAPAMAHPHVWIDARYQIEADDPATVRRVAVEWRFDDLYSQSTARIIDVDLDQTVSVAELQDLITEAMTNLKEWSYFLDLRQGDRKLAVGTAEGARATYEDGLLVFRFTVPLARPADLARGPLVLRGYDPSLYIGVEVQKEKPVQLSAGLSACRAETVPPPALPTRSLMSEKQFSGDVAPGSEGIGFAFAAISTVTCSPR